jgi:hypothetical protein
VFRRWQNAIEQDAVHKNTRRHDCLATAVDLDLPLLHLQHEFATRGATAALSKAPPRFLVAYGQITSGQRSRALIRMSFTRDSARFAVHPPTSSRGRSWTGGPGARTRHNRNFITVSNPYIRLESGNSKGRLGALPPSWPGIAVRRTASLRSPMSRPSTPLIRRRPYISPPPTSPCEWRGGVRGGGREVGTDHAAEVHWYEVAGIGRKEFKIKRLL